MVNSGTALHHRQSLPGLTAGAKVAKTKAKKFLIVVTVTDAVDPVPGAKVRLSGHGTKVTKAAGRVKFWIPKKASLPKKISGKATKPGYYPASFSVKVGKDKG